MLPELDAGAFAFVMATGIVSVAAFVHRLFALSDALWAVACAGWVVLAACVALRAVRAPRRPALRSFAVVAATAVLGARFALAGETVVALVLWALAALLWLALLARRPSLGDVAGASLLVVVGTESLAVLAALLATRETHAFVDVALAAWLLGLILYPLVVAAIALAQRRRPRFAPDLWVVMGALAIATLAGTELLLASHALHSELADVDLATWALASMLIVPLAAAELRLRATWRYSPERWSFVFPLGMYAVASSTLARAEGLSLASAVGRAFLVVALAMWALTSLGLVRFLHAV